MQNTESLYKHKFLTIVSWLMLPLLIVAVMSCEKTDDINPDVKIISPLGGSYSVMDTIRVRAKISDNEIIKTVSVMLLDLDNQVVCPSNTYSVSASSYSLDVLFLIDNLYLESGKYYLVVEASDGFNTQKKYVSIIVGGLDRSLEDILIVEKDNLKTSIYSIMNGKVLLKEFQFEYQDFIYNPYSEQYVFLSNDGILTAYSKEDVEELWRVENLNSPSYPYQGSLFYKDQLTYVSTYSGEIRAYNGQGNVVKQANTVDNKGQISQYYFAYDKIMAVKKPFVNGNDRIEELNEVTGASVRTYEISFSPEKILFVDQDLSVVFGNQYSEAKACSLSTLYNLVQPFGDFQSRKLGDAHQYSEYFYILSLDNQIVEYNLSNGNERFLENTQANVEFFYEDIYKKLYYIDGNNISILSFPADGHVDYYSNGSNISDLIFVYNK